MQILVLGTDTPSLPPNCKLVSSTKSYYSSLREHDYDFALLFRKDVQFAGSLDILSKVLTSSIPFDILHICANVKCDLLTEKGRVSEYDLPIANSVIRTHCVLVTREVASVLVSNAYTNSDMLKELARCSRTRRLSWYQDKVRHSLHVESRMVYPNPVAISQDCISQRDDVQRLCNTCVPSDELTPASIDSVYYFFATIVILFLILFGILIMKSRV